MLTRNNTKEFLKSSSVGKAFPFSPRIDFQTQRFQSSLAIHGPAANQGERATSNPQSRRRRSSDTICRRRRGERRETGDKCLSSVTASRRSLPSARRQASAVYAKGRRF